MTMQQLLKPLGEWAIKWKVQNKPRNKNDEFFVARLRLTFYYSITAIFILAGSSIVIYNTVISNFSQSIWEESLLDPTISQAIIDRAQDILLNRFITIDFVLIIFIVILGFFLTNKTLQPIQSNMQRQKRFIADASHELRTPIAIVISGLEVNLNNKKLDLAGAKKTLKNTLEEMREFSRLSNSLLDISKYDTPMQIEYEPIVMDELLRSIIEKNRNLASIKEIYIETKVKFSVIIRGNKMELNRVFFNIFDNAIKYTSPKGTIIISDKIEANNYIITITDNGMGIKNDNLNKIFDPFFRADAARSKSGVGLGLTLSQKIIENHQGTISIKSQENKGTIVAVSLPLSS